MHCWNTRRIEPLSDIALLVFILRARAARYRTGIEHHGRATVVVEAGVYMLQPCPITSARRNAARSAKTIEWIVRLEPQGDVTAFEPGMTVWFYR